MPDTNLEDTHPNRIRAEDTQPRRLPQSSSSPPPSTGRRRWLWAPILTLLFASVIAGGALAGYRSAKQAQVEQSVSQSQQALQEQFDLGVKDLQAKQYEVARQRFEFILKEDPAFPGAADHLAEVFAVLYATATPTSLPPTITPTPTRDLRPVQDLFQSAQALFANQDWSGTIDTLLALRKSDPAYEVVQVDRLLYLCLRSRGIAKILNEGHLAEGIYDLALAARFAPLDTDAANPREWARLYMIGLSFWEVDPKQAVDYFSQVAAAVPGLRDASGITANERYRQALIQYGDLLAGQNQWCEAQSQYEQSLRIAADPAVEEKFRQAAQGCNPQSPTPGTPTSSPTPTNTLPPGVTPSVTPTPTFTLPVPATTAVSPTSEAPPTTAVLPTDTQAPPPTDTLPPPPTEPQPAPEPSATTGAPESPPTPAAALWLFTLLISLGSALLPPFFWRGR